MMHDAADNLLTAEDPDSKYTYEYNLLSQNTSVSNADTPGVAQLTFTQAHLRHHDSTTIIPVMH